MVVPSFNMINIGQLRISLGSGCHLAKQWKQSLNWAVVMFPSVRWQ